MTGRVAVVTDSTATLRPERTGHLGIGVIPLITGLVGNCPASSLLGVSTCPRHA